MVRTAVPWLCLIGLIGSCDRPAASVPEPPQDSPAAPYQEAFEKLGKSADRSRTGCLSCHQGMTDLSLLAAKRGDELMFLDPDLQKRAVEIYPDPKVRQRMILAARAHPKPDISYGPHSKHPGMSCETCHVPEERRDDPTLTPARKKYWIEHHLTYHPVVKDLPLRLSHRVQAVCLKCHLGEEPLPGAENINRGRVLYQETACNACHLSYGLKIRKQDLLPGEKPVRRVGPPLSSIASKVDKKWAYSWISHTPSFKPAARMPPIFPREVVGLPPSVVPEGTKKEQIKEYEAVMISCAVEYLFAQSRPLELEEIPPGILEVEEWKIADQVERGRAIVRDRGCLGCHKFEEDYPAGYFQTQIFLEEEFATNLFGSGNKFDSPLGKRWLYNWLKKPQHYSIDTPMPVFGFKDAEIGDLIQFLLSLKIDNEARKTNDLKTWNPRDPPLSAQGGSPEMVKLLDVLVAHQKGPTGATLAEKVLWEGRFVVDMFTCYSCHKLGEEWEAKPIVWGTVSHDLLPPRLIMARMPLYELNPNESNLMVTYLWGAVEGSAPPKDRHVTRPERKAVAEGEYLLRKFNCQGCHTLDHTRLHLRDGDRVRAAEAMFKSRLERTADSPHPHWAVDWLRTPSTLDYEPVQKKYQSVVPVPIIERWEPARGGVFVTRRYALADEEEADIIPYKVPPSLRTVGRKLKAGWMRAFLESPVKLRPLDGPVMPRFAFHEGEIDAIVSYFRAKDGAVPADDAGRLSEKEVEARYADLLKADEAVQGSCALCHTTDGQGAAASVDLGIVHARLQRPWLRAFLEEPSSIYPGTPMPALTKDVKLDDITDLLLNYDIMRAVKIRRGGAKEILEALRSIEDDIDRLVPMALRRLAGDASLAEIASTAMSLALKRNLKPRAELEALLEHPTTSVRAGAIDTLIRIGSADSLDRIAGKFADAEAVVRRAALTAVRYFGSRGHMAAIRGMLSDADEQNRIHALQAVGAFRAVEETAAVEERLADKDSLVRRAALETLSILGASGSSGPIAARLKDDEIQVRVKAADTLAELGAADRAAELTAALADPNVPVRCASLLALGKIGKVPEEAVRLLESEEPSVRASAAACLLSAGDPRGRDPFQRALQERPFDALTRRAVVRGIHSMIPAEWRKKAVEPGDRTVVEWLEAIGGAPGDEPETAEKLKLRVESRARDRDGLLSFLSERSGLVLVMQGGRPTAVSLDRGVEHALK
jgi:HEAT repeat protein/mono/diheme cytochrome c family protein